MRNWNSEDRCIFTYMCWLIYCLARLSFYFPISHQHNR